MNDWYVLHIRPRCEKKMAEYCRAHKLSHYLPLRSETKIYQRRKVTVDKPVFPGYFFASFNADGRLLVLKTNNVIRILTPPNRREMLHQLAQIRRALTVDSSLGTCAAVSRGRRVRITGGPFMGIEGVVWGSHGPAKVRLNVEMIGRAITVEVDRIYLEPTEE